MNALLSFTKEIGTLINALFFFSQLEINKIKENT